VNVKKWQLALLVALITVGLCSAGHTAWKRSGLERQYRTASVAVAYDEVSGLAAQYGLPTADVLVKFRKAGAGTVLVKETTVRDAEQSGELVLKTGRELLLLDESGFLAAAPDFRAWVKPDYLYLFASDRQSFARVLGQLKAKNVPLRAWEREPYVIETGLAQGTLEQTGIGFPDRILRDISAAGMQPVVQLRTWTRVTPAGLAYVFAAIGQIPNLGAVAFNDASLPGTPGENTRALVKAIKKLNVPVVQIEFFNQVGLTKLGLLLDNKIIRMHSLGLDEDIKKNYSLTAIVDRYELAAAERNIRLLLAHTYYKPGDADPLRFNLQLVQAIKDSLEADGLKDGAAANLPPLPVSPLLLFLTGLGVIAGGMLLACAMGWRRTAIFLGPAALLLWAAVLALPGLGLINLGCKLMAFASVVIFPTLSLSLHVSRAPASPARCVLLLLRTSLLSFAGALLMVGLLANTAFMLKLDQFTGVKLAHVIPLILLAGIFFARDAIRTGGWRRQAQRFMEQPILVKFALVAGVVLVALIIYVSRTGNESLGVPGLELKFRTLLNTFLGVRPRTKEFLLGYPLLMLLFYLGFRDNRYQPLLLAGAIGQVSLVNTYAHIHTPLLISLQRSFNGLWVGIIGGLVLIVLWKAGAWLAAKYWT